MVKVSAPAKVHLIGEHAVVYNQPAILAAVGLRSHVIAEKSDDVEIKCSGDIEFFESFPVSEIKEYTDKVVKMWEDSNEKGDFSPIFAEMKASQSNALKLMIGVSMKELGIDGGVYIEVSSEIPIGSGLGSSASLAASIPMAIGKTYGKDIDKEENNKIAFEIEKLMHGKPSGGDNSACNYGGLVWFVKGNPNTIDSLREQVPYSLKGFVLFYAHKPVKTTGELVQQVMDLDEDFRNERVEAIGKGTHEMLEALKTKDFEKIKDLINFAHEKLTELGVSTDKLDEAHKAIKEIGGAAKGCGALGGGVMLCWHEDTNKLCAKIKELGYKPLIADLAVEGVRVDEE